MKNETTFERTSDRELVVTRVFAAPAERVFEAWTQPAIMKRWWMPRSVGMTMDACEIDARTGGSYRFVFRMGEGEPMAFFGKYVEVIPGARLVWTNEESADGSLTTVTFEDLDGATKLVVHERHPSKAALDESRASGIEACTVETFDQLDELLAS